MAALFDTDERPVKRNFRLVDWTRLPQATLYLWENVSPGGPVFEKARRVLGLGLRRVGTGRDLIEIRCERGADISRLLGFPEETARAIRSLDEHWDGSGYPDGLRGEEIPFLARICGLAQTAEAFYSAYGPRRAEEMVEGRRGRWFSLEVSGVFLQEAREGRLWETLGGPRAGSEVSFREPPERVVIGTPERLDLVARAFARIIDAKSPCTFRHSERVAAITAAVTEYMGFPEPVVRDQTRAGLLHDIGKLGVSSRILDKPGKLTPAEFAEVRKHPALTHNVLNLVSPFRSFAATAAAHHEKLDGSGYHRGLTARELSLPARILAVADIYEALSSERPYRPPMPLERISSILRSERETRLCAESVDALLTLASEDRLELPEAV